MHSVDTQWCNFVHVLIPLTGLNDEDAVESLRIVGIQKRLSGPFAHVK